MTKLLSVIKGKTPGPRRILIYGVHGIGKSTFGAKAENPIFVQTEEGLADIECHKFPMAETFRDIMDAVTALYLEEHDYKTLVLDSGDWAEHLIWADVVARHNLRGKKTIGSIEEIGYAKGYTMALTQWREMLDGFDGLVRKRGMSIIIIAHAKIERFQDPESEAYDRYSPRLHKHAAHMVQEWCSEVLFANYKVHTVKRSDSFDSEKEKSRAIGSGERILRTTERPAFLAKNRLGLPDEIPLDYEAFAAYVRGDKQEQKGTP